MKYLLPLLFFFATQASALELKQVQDHYRGIKSISAEIEQTKTSPLLLRPLRSKVQLKFEGEVLSWSVAGQEPWRIRFLKDGKTEFLSSSKVLKDIPADAKAKLDRTMALVRKILLMDQSLNQDFNQVIVGDTLQISPKSKDKSVFFEKVGIEFDKKLEIKSISLKTAEDDTLLVFTKLILQRS